MAATKLIAMHQNKGRSVMQCLKDRTDYASSAGSDVSGEAVGLGLGLGAGLVATILSGLLFLIARFDILCSSLLALLIYLLTYKYEWNTPIYIIGAIVIFAVSMLLQHFLKCSCTVRKQATENKR